MRTASIPLFEICTFFSRTSKFRPHFTDMSTDFIRSSLHRQKSPTSHSVPHRIFRSWSKHSFAVCFCLISSPSLGLTVVTSTLTSHKETSSIPHCCHAPTTSTRSTAADTFIRALPALLSESRSSRHHFFAFLTLALDANSKGLEPCEFLRLLLRSFKPNCLIQKGELLVTLHLSQKFTVTLINPSSL